MKERKTTNQLNSSASCQVMKPAPVGRLHHTWVYVMVVVARCPFYLVCDQMFGGTKDYTFSLCDNLLHVLFTSTDTCTTVGDIGASS